LEDAATYLYLFCVTLLLSSLFFFSMSNFLPHDMPQITAYHPQNHAWH